MNARPDLALRRRETRAVILQAAIAEFAEKGLDGATTQGIADRAGITKTKLHYHIDSKEELYTEALAQVMNTWNELFHGLDMSTGPKTFLTAYIRRKVAHAVAHPEEVRLFTGEIIRGAPYLSAKWEQSRTATRQAAEVIQGWVTAGLIRPVDPMLLQFNLWAMTEHYALHQAEARFMLGLAEDAAPDIDAIADSITALVLHGLLA